jgi:hypothetical protein
MAQALDERFYESCDDSNWHNSHHFFLRSEYGGPARDVNSSLTVVRTQACVLMPPITVPPYVIGLYRITGSAVPAQ